MTEQNKYDVLLKILVEGDTSVGKTSIITRYIKDVFIQQQFTIGIEFQQKYIERFDKIVKLQLFEICGAERKRSPSNFHIRSNNGLVFVYDITNRLSFDNLKKHIDIFVLQREKKDLISILVGNKQDLEIHRAVSYNEAQQLANSYGMNFFETSAMTSENVSNCINELVNQLLIRK